VLSATNSFSSHDDSEDENLQGPEKEALLPLPLPKRKQSCEDMSPYGEETSHGALENETNKRPRLAAEDLLNNEQDEDTASYFS